MDKVDSAYKAMNEYLAIDVLRALYEGSYAFGEDSVRQNETQNRSSSNNLEPRKVEIEQMESEKAMTGDNHGFIEFEDIFAKVVSLSTLDRDVTDGVFDCIGKRGGPRVCYPLLADDPRLDRRQPSPEEREEFNREMPRRKSLR